MRSLKSFFHGAVFFMLSLVLPAVCGAQWTNWAQINTDGFGNTNNFSAFSMAVYGGKLYVGTWNNPDGCGVWRCDGSGTGDWTQINTNGFGSANNRGAHAMAVYNDCLYVGTANNTAGFEVWKYDGSSWTRVAGGGLGDSANTWAGSMVVHDNILYLGTSFQAGVFTYDGSTWTQINENGFGDSDNQQVRSLAVYGGKVYAGVYNTTDNANLYRYDGPTTSDWTLVASGGFGGNFVEFRSLAAYDGKLFIGGSGWSTSCQVWEYDGAAFTRNDPGASMQYDAARCMTVFQGKLYVGTGNDSGVPSGGQVWEYDGTTWDQVNDNGFGDTTNEAVHSLAADGSSLFAGVANSDGDGGKVFASVQAPIVTTQAVTGINTTTATGNGTISDLGYSNPTAYGVCWNTGGTPTTADSCTDEGAIAATGSFTSGMTGLTLGTTYYVRAYATNTAGTGYGDQVAFTTDAVLTMALTPVGGGTTTPAEGSDTNVDAGVPVNITATAAAGYNFVNWTAAPTGNAVFGNAAGASTNVTLTGSATISANFVRNFYTLTYIAGTGGSIQGPGSQTVAFGFNGAQVTALPEAGYSFSQWSDGVTTTTRTDTNVIGNIMVTAEFVINSYTLTYTAGTGGSIQGPTPQSVAYGFNGQQVTALPAEGYHFMQWSDGKTDNPRLDANVTGDISVTAEFEATPISSYPLTVHNGIGSGNYAAGHVVTIAADLPSDGLIFDQWAGDQEAVSGIYLPNAFVRMPDEPVTVTATYKNQGGDTYLLSVQKGDGDGNYLPGMVVNIFADEPADGLIFDRWTGASGYVTNSNLPATTLVMPSSDITVTATYKARGDQAYPLTVIDGSGSGDYLPGTIINPVADTPPAGQIFDQWTGDTNNLANINLPATYLYMPAAPTMLTATYKDQGTDEYTLTVSGGSGSGNYLPGTEVAISASVPEGLDFETWTGQTGWMLYTGLADTTLTMPEADITVMAEFTIDGNNDSHHSHSNCFIDSLLH